MRRWNKFFLVPKTTESGNFTIFHRAFFGTEKLSTEADHSNGLKYSQTLNAREYPQFLSQIDRPPPLPLGAPLSWAHNLAQLCRNLNEPG